MPRKLSKILWTSISSRPGAKNGFAATTPICARARRRPEPMDFGLKGRVAIVAASSKGLGRAVAEEFAREGCELAICARTAKDLESAAAEIGKTNGRSVFWQALDVTN